MSKLFVCVGKKAATPYSIPAEHLRIFTIEELCYYICEKAGVLDRNLMREQLVDYIGKELALPELAGELEEIVRKERPLHEFCGAILHYTGYMSSEIREHIVLTIRENETLPVVKRLEQQGDTYFRQKQYYIAQKTYRNMLLREEVQKDPGLKAEIYAKIGNVAAMMFQYETAAYCYEKSCSFEEKREVRKKYLLCRRFLMTKENFLEWVAGQEEYYDLSVDVEREFEKVKQQMTEQVQEKTESAEIETLKEEFCRMVLE